MSSTGSQKRSPFSSRRWQAPFPRSWPSTSGAVWHGHTADKPSNSTRSNSGSRRFKLTSNEKRSTLPTPALNLTPRPDSGDLSSTLRNYSRQSSASGMSLCGRIAHLVAPRPAWCFLLHAHLRQDVLDAALQLPKLLWTPKAQDQRLCPSSNEGIEPGCTAHTCPGAQPLLAYEDLVGCIVIALSKCLHLALGLGDVVVDVQRGVDTAGQRLHVFAHLSCQPLQPLPLRCKHVWGTRVGEPALTQA